MLLVSFGLLFPVAFAFAFTILETTLLRVLPSGKAWQVSVWIEDHDPQSRFCLSCYLDVVEYIIR